MDDRSALTLTELADAVEAHLDNDPAEAPWSGALRRDAGIIEVVIGGHPDLDRVLSDLAQAFPDDRLVVRARREPVGLLAYGDHRGCGLRRP